MRNRRRAAAYKTFIIATLLLLAIGRGAAGQGKAGTGERFAIAQIHYGGGGDWYEDRTSMVRLQERLRQELGLTVESEPKFIKLTDEDLFSYPMIYMTGHGNVFFTPEEAAKLRTYLERGGFLWANDDYGMDEAFRREMKKVFSDTEFVELPFDHSIYRTPYEFPNGSPKIHEHAGGSPHCYAIFIDKRMVVFYDFNTDIGDGLEAPEIHNDPPEKREQAFSLAVNIVFHVLSQ